MHQKQSGPFQQQKKRQKQLRKKSAAKVTLLANGQNVQKQTTDGQIVRHLLGKFADLDNSKSNIVLVEQVPVLRGGSI